MSLRDMIHFHDDFYDDYNEFDELFLRALHLSFLTSTLPTHTIYEPSSLQQLCVDYLLREKMPKTVDSAAHLVAVLSDLFYNSLYERLAENVRQFLYARATWLLEKYHHHDLQDRFGHELYNALVKIDKERAMALKRMESFRTGKMIERTTTAAQNKNTSFDNGNYKSPFHSRILRSNASNTNVTENNFGRSSSNNGRSISSNSNSNSSNSNSNIQHHPNVSNQLQIYYPVERLLQGMIWPAGVDPAHREQYLSPDSFFSLFGMTKEEFSALKHFVQERKKKEKGLF